MALNLYRRHESSCAGGHPNRSQTYQTDELRRDWKKCFCVIQVAGTLAGRFHRKSNGVRTWEQASTLCSVGAPGHLAEGARRSSHRRARSSASHCRRDLPTHHARPRDSSIPRGSPESQWPQFCAKYKYDQKI